MIEIRYDPETKIYIIIIDGIISKGEYTIYQIIQKLQNYIIEKEGVKNGNL